MVAAWIAVLVPVDNCTRRSLGLPLFAVGAHVPAEMVAEALAVLLPKGLAYLIADRGAHFTAGVIKELERGRVTLLSGVLLPLSLGPAWMRVLAHFSPLYYGGSLAHPVDGHS